MKLYGLYKQATEGDVEGIMSRPIGFTLEDEGAKKKWDAWKREQGLSKTEAKRHYISYLIDTMKFYATGTIEARELLSELEYLWDQIKDLEFTPEDEIDHIPNIAFPNHSPLLSQTDQSDRYSSVTPWGKGSNLHKIYSHSRRSTMNVNEYVQQQRRAGSVKGSVYSDRGRANPTSNLPAPTYPVNSLPNLPTSSLMDDFKTWQGEINLIINKLSREFMNRRPSESDDPVDSVEKVKRRIISLLKLLGLNAFRILKSFSISILAILFIVWCIKKNVIVKRTMVRKPGTNGTKTEELVINMILNTDENKWFIRMLNFVNSFVGFV